MTVGRLASPRGQASVEMVAFLPLLAAVVLAAVHVLAAGEAEESARGASHAGAMAILQDGDPRAAARSALGGAARRASIAVRGRRVTVTVRPRTSLPALGALLTARDTAHAGPGPAAATWTGPAIRGGDGESARSGR